jgi:hypothetical protein
MTFKYGTRISMIRIALSCGLPIAKLDKEKLPCSFISRFQSEASSFDWKFGYFHMLFRKFTLQS